MLQPKQHESKWAREGRKAKWLQQFERKMKEEEMQGDGAESRWCVRGWERVCEETGVKKKEGESVQAGLIANTDISGRPACVFFSLAKGGLHSPFLPPLLAVPLTPLLLHLAGVNHQIRIHLYPHSSYYSLFSSLLPSISFYCPLLLFQSPPEWFRGSRSLSVFVTLSHLFLGASGKHELWKDNRQVMGEVCGRVCVCMLCGGGCAHLHVCTQMTKATVRLCHLNPIWKWFHMSFWFFSDTELTPTKPLTLETLSSPTRTVAISQYAPIYCIIISWTYSAFQKLTKKPCGWRVSSLAWWSQIWSPLQQVYPSVWVSSTTGQNHAGKSVLGDLSGDSK